MIAVWFKLVAKSGEDLPGTSVTEVKVDAQALLLSSRMLSRLNAQTLSLILMLQTFLFQGP